MSTATLNLELELEVLEWSHERVCDELRARMQAGVFVDSPLIPSPVDAHVYETQPGRFDIRVIPQPAVTVPPESSPDFTQEGRWVARCLVRRHRLLGSLLCALVARQKPGVQRPLELLPATSLVTQLALDLSVSPVFVRALLRNKRIDTDTGPQSLEAFARGAVEVPTPGLARTMSDPRFPQMAS